MTNVVNEAAYSLVVGGWTAMLPPGYDTSSLYLDGQSKLYFWVPQEYVGQMSCTVTFCSEGKALGRAVVETGKNTNQAAASLYKPTRAGYVLSGWYDKDGNVMFDAQGRAVNGKYWKGSYVPNSSSATWQYAGSVIAYARWTPNMYVVTFYGGGKTLGTATVEYGKNTNQAAASAYKPTRDGYVLTGWYDANGKIMFDAQGRAANGDYWNGSYVPGSSSATWKFAGNVTAYANWAPAPTQKYTVTFYGGGKTLGTATVETGKNTNQAAASAYKPTRAGYMLTGWYDANGKIMFDAQGRAANGVYWNGSYVPGSSSAMWKFAGNVTAYANWAPAPTQKYTVTFYGGGKTLGTATVEMGKNTNQAAASAYKPTRAGYVLTGWYDASGKILFDAQGRAANGDYWNGSYVPGSSSATWKFAGNVTAYANWAPAPTQKYTVTFYGGGKTLGTATVEMGKNTNQAAASAHKPTRAGYVLTGWYDANGKIIFDAQGRAANGVYWNGSYAPGSSSATWKFAGNVTAYAHWTPGATPTFTVVDGVLLGVQLNGATDVTIPDGVTSIGDGAFEGCEALTGVTIPNSVTNIGSYAFYGCSGLTSVTISDSVTSIGDYAFYICSGLTHVTIPDSVTSIGSYAFAGCSGLTHVTIPSGVTSIRDGAFSGCSGLTHVTIPSGVTSIRDVAFSGCKGLTSVTIPDSVTIIGYQAFSGCSGIKSVTVPQYVLDRGLSIFSSYQFITNVAYSSIITNIGTGAFLSCSGLTSVTIPDSVTSIGPLAFEGCSSLPSVTIPDSVTSIGDGAFEGCEALTSVTIPDGVTSIGEKAFSGCIGLTRVTISDSVTSIGAYAFAYCDDLTSVAIPSSVTSIGDGAFVGCGAMSDEDGFVIVLNVLHYYCGSTANVAIPSSVTSIGANAFAHCRGLTSVTIPSGVTSIGDYAFYQCRGLTSVTIPSSVTSIGSEAFWDCIGLTSVTIPSGVTSIGSDAFYRCTAVTDVHLHADPAVLTWTEDACNDFMSDKATKIHVKPSQLAAFQSKLGSIVNGTFVGDLGIFTVTFYGGGATLGTATVEMGKNTNQAAASQYKPTRAGYVLTGWYDANDNILFDAQGRAVNGMYWNGSYVKGTSSATWKYEGNVTAYAHWAPAPTQKYVVTLNANGGTFASGGPSVTFQVEIGKNTNQAGAKRTVTPPQGYTLVGWYDQDGNKIFDAMGYAVSGKYWNGSYWPNESSATWKYTGNVTAYARWLANSNAAARKVSHGANTKGGELFVPGEFVGIFADGEGTFALTLDEGLETAYLVTWTADGGVTRECEVTVDGDALVLATEDGEVYRLAWEGGSLVATREE